MESLFNYLLMQIVNADFKPIGTNSNSMQCFENDAPFDIVFHKDDVAILREYLNSGVYMLDRDRDKLAEFIAKLEKIFY